VQREAMSRKLILYAIGIQTERDSSIQMRIRVWNHTILLHFFSIKALKSEESRLFSQTQNSHTGGAKKKTPWVPFIDRGLQRTRVFFFRVVQFRLMAQNTIILLKQQGVSGVFSKAKCKKVSFLTFSFCVHGEGLMPKSIFDILAPSAFVSFRIQTVSAKDFTASDAFRALFAREAQI